MENQKTKYKIIGACRGCRTCYRNCPVNAITQYPVKIIDDICIRCGKCAEICPAKCIIKIEE